MTFDFDAWRRAYSTMTVDDQRRAYSAIWAISPVQRHYDADAVANVIVEYGARTIVEIGGWDGALADEMLARFPTITRWRNVEVCAEACTVLHADARYEAICRSHWYWDDYWLADLFVASHTIEHLSVEHLEATIRATRARTLFFDAPLADSPMNWWGSTTTHILAVGWPEVDEICARYGYRLESRRTHKLPPSSGGWSTQSIYVRAGT